MLLELAAVLGVPGVPVVQDSPECPKKPNYLIDLFYVGEDLKDTRVDFSSTTALCKLIEITVILFEKIPIPTKIANKCHLAEHIGRCRGTLNMCTIKQ